MLIETAVSLFNNQKSAFDADRFVNSVSALQSVSEHNSRGGDGGVRVLLFAGEHSLAGNHLGLQHTLDQHYWLGRSAFEYTTLHFNSFHQSTILCLRVRLSVVASFSMFPYDSTGRGVTQSVRYGELATALTAATT